VPDRALGRRCPAGESWVVDHYFAVVDQFPSAAAGSAGAGDGGKVGLPALDVTLAFPQATPASLFPPAGEISTLCRLRSRGFCRTSFSNLVICVLSG
jgi:hypothetical protein